MRNQRKQGFGMYKMLDNHFFLMKKLTNVFFNFNHFDKSVQTNIEL